MNDQQYRRLLSAILDLKVEVAALSIAVRSAPRCACSDAGVDDAKPCANPDGTHPAIAELLRNTKP